ncbi:MAG: Fur family transcriptional regulator [Chitinispirillaceae bacterium]
MKQQDRKQRFRNYLRSRGLSFTPQRKFIFDYLSSNTSHFGAEELITALRQHRINVSRATVYRTLGHLEEAGFIRKIELDQNHTHWEYVDGCSHHEHLVCEKCGRIEEFTDPQMEHRINAVAEQNRFTITRHTVQIFGICGGCSEHQET